MLPGAGNLTLCVSVLCMCCVCAVHVLCLRAGNLTLCLSVLCLCAGNLTLCVSALCLCCDCDVTVLCLCCGFAVSVAVCWQSDGVCVCCACTHSRVQAAVRTAAAAIDTAATTEVRSGRMHYAPLPPPRPPNRESAVSSVRCNGRVVRWAATWLSPPHLSSLSPSLYLAPLFIH